MAGDTVGIGAVTYDIAITYTDGKTINTSVVVPRVPVDSNDTVTGTDGEATLTLAQMLDKINTALQNTDVGVKVAALTAVTEEGQPTEYVLNGNTVRVTRADGSVETLAIDEVLEQYATTLDSIDRRTSGLSDDGSKYAGDVGGSSVSVSVYPIAAVHIIAGGANYAVGDNIMDGSGYLTQVAEVDASGGVTKLTNITKFTVDGSTKLLRAATTSGVGYNLAYEFAFGDPELRTSRSIEEVDGANRSLNSLGLKLDGTDTSENIQEVMNSLKNYSIYYAHSTTSGVDVAAAGYTAAKNIIVEDINTRNFYGDGVLVEGIDQGKTIRRSVIANTDWVASQFSDLYYTYTGPLHPDNQSNTWVKTTFGKDRSGNIAAAKGNLTNIRSDIQSYGTADAGNFMVNISATNVRYGTDWQWALIGVVQDQPLNNAPILDHNTQEWLAELDYGAWGPDGGTNTSIRNGIMVTGWQLGGGYNAKWAATTTYGDNSAIQASINGRLYSVIAAVGGISGTTEPDWSVLAISDSDFKTNPVSTRPTVVDGTVTWRVNGLMRASIDNVIVASYQPDTNNAQDVDLPPNKYGARTPFVYHQFLKTDAVFDGPVINLGNAQFVSGSVNIGVSLPEDAYIDFSRVYNSSKSRVNILGYDSATSSLAYKINNNTVWSINDAGVVVGQQNYSYTGAFTDPDPGVARDAKFGGMGIAVRGGVKTDSLVVLGSSAVPANPTAAGTTGQVEFDDANGYMYRCVSGGAAGSAKWVRFPIDTTWT